MRIPRVLAFLLLLASVAACSGVQTAGDAKEPPPTTIEVRNLRTVDCNLFVLNTTRRVRYRLGTIPGMSTRGFVIPPRFLGEADRLRFIVEVVGSDEGVLTDEELPVTPGEQLSLTLQP